MFTSLFSVSLCMCLIIWFCFLCCISLCIKFNFLSLGGYNWMINFDFDFVTLGVVLMLVICFLYVYFYTHHYFVGDLVGFELNKIIILFVVVMGVLVSTGDFLTTLIFWEYLGVVSFFLILFYDNFLSLRSSIVTLVSSRFGDVCLFLLIGLSCFMYSNYLFCIAIFFLIIFTKSASFPFISWLLEAMRAPTPVSSLVHSSTLVAAGIWFAMRYDYMQFFSNSICFSVLLVLTILITALSSLFFMDLKKIIALSTCNNIAWCVLYLIYGDLVLSLFQLLSHGVSKCILFMLIGDIMSGSSGSQGSNCVYSSNLYGNWNLFSSTIVILGLAGIPFIGVFFTKHFLLSMFVNIVNVVVCLTICLCMFMSYLYSFRLCAVLFNVKSSISSGVLFFFNSGLMVFFWLFINFYVFLTLDETVYLNGFIGFSLIVFQLLSILITCMFYDSNLISNWSSSLFGCDNLVELCYVKFYHILNSVSLFFFRWDKIIIELFTGIGLYNVGRLFIWVLLNLLMVSGFTLIIYVLIW
uniref:NADH:ubiquinone reductase (H(+)-translocating) n=2 Tax=Taenia multiceps TaxID=94034 RepID=C6KIC4_TAEMU|nr:NADH dehydrogenase subunit 5 [Taenia multiceps]ACS37257.1 NADH dehydrogenase subunit 5 [Taenia multiceps]